LPALEPLHHPSGHNLTLVRAVVARLEQLADRKLNSTPEDPPMRAKIDTALRPQFIADRSAGLTLAQLAQKYNVSQSTAGYWVHKLNGQPRNKTLPEKIPEGFFAREARQDAAPTSNGHPDAGNRDTTELDQLLLDHWSQLPLLTRVKLLLDRS
jgi:hypothetical protein